MKLVQGPRLDEHAGERPLSDRLRLFTRICDAVAFAHSQGVVHRDIKPDNIMVGFFGEVLVMDWGVAQVVADGLPGHLHIAASNCRPSSAPAATWRRNRRVGKTSTVRADVFALGGFCISC